MVGRQLNLVNEQILDLLHSIQQSSKPMKMKNPARSVQIPIACKFPLCIAGTGPKLFVTHCQQFKCEHKRMHVLSFTENTNVRPEQERSLMAWARKCSQRVMAFCENMDSYRKPSVGTCKTTYLGTQDEEGRTYTLTWKVIQVSKEDK